MSNINVNITYVFTGWDDIENVAYNLYAGYDEELGEKAVKESIYCDFEKEVWHNGVKVQVFNKSRIEDDWGVREDKLKGILEDALEASKKLVEQLDKFDGTKGLATNPKVENDAMVLLRDISNNVNTINSIMRDLYV